jgi:VIT1/CCC1 family predicted Fe2+/Mn2+ transporter
MAGLFEKHYLHKVGWLRAAVLGANDGILSTASIAVGVAAASTERTAIVLAALAGLVSGAMSMAAGEYVSVSSQADTEKADLEREKKELEEMPEEELHELAEIYQRRGLTPALSLEVATQLTAHNALEAHARDELNITELTTARPLQAALASFASFALGATLPLLVSIWAPMKTMIWWQYGCCMFFLIVLGATAAKAGGSPVITASLRICFWGTAAMILTALVGYFFGVNV